MTDQTPDTSELAPAVADTPVETPEAIEPDTEFATPPDDTETETPEEPPRYTVKLDGKEVEVTLDELRNGYQRQADYTAKTQALADRQRELSARTQRWDSAIQQGETLVSVLANEFQAEFNGINWTELAQNDPAQWALKTQQRNERLGKLQQAFAVLQQTKQAKTAEDETSEAQRLTEEESNLLSKIPEWKNATKRAEEAAALSSWMIEQGYSREDLQALNKGRHLDVVVARKAMLYDRLMSQVPRAQPVPKAPPPAAPAPSKAKAAPNPDTMTTDQWLKWRNAQLKKA